MIIEAIAGIVVAVSAGTFFVIINYIDTANRWIIETSKFIYFSGHPVLDDDEIYELITIKFRKVFTSFLALITKTIIFIVGALIIVALSSIILNYLNTSTFIDRSDGELVSRLFPDYLYGFPFIIGTLIPIVIIPFFQKNKHPNPYDPYSPLEKFLHYIFLGNANIARFIFRFELIRNKKLLNSSNTLQNVYVSGMARAGTTVLMQYLAEIPQFKSLSYRNMPFIFLPRTWLKHSLKKEAGETERFHKDGMKHSVDTQEALEEPFWRNYIGAGYINEDVITAHSIDNETYYKYDAFRKLVAENSIYLAKNNNHLLRAESLHKLDTENENKTITVIPFRYPYAQAKSLLTQHKTLSSLQERNEFALDYMDFLVHHEFGLHHKMSILSENENLLTPEGDKDSIEYWAKIWYLFYKDALEKYADKKGFHFFCYEKFVEDPRSSLVKIISLLEVPADQINSIEIKKFTPKKNNEPENVNQDYINLYNELVSKAVNNES